MHEQRESFKIFSERKLSEYLKDNKQKIKSYIEQESENYILNVNETNYINHLTSNFIINKLNIDFANVKVSSYEKQIPAEHFPNRVGVHLGKSYSKQVYIYYIPFTGNYDLLQYFSSTRLVWTTEVYIEDQYLCFEVISFREDAEEIKNISQHIINNIRTQLKYLNKDIDDYNAQLQLNIEQTFRALKNKYLKKNKILASLGVPIRKMEELPQTYSIPTIKTRKSINTKPIVKDSGYKPEPAIDQSIYNEILQIIYDVGKVFERLPSTYSDKKEEDLRDHLLLYLEPRFEGLATGETFNKSGKTDILIRYKNSNVFIAECKFWKGQKHYLKTITQLLGYLTWRDSKAAVVIFVRNKDFSSVLQIVEEATSNHSNYIGFVDKKEESWFNYLFHVNNDPNREVKLAVLLFHIP